MQPGFMIDADSGLLRAARQVLSPHCDERPPGTALELIVVHGISLPPGEYGGPWIEQLFTGGLDPAAHPYYREVAGLRVSSHLLVRRDGAVLQFVPFGLRAWHAGIEQGNAHPNSQRPDPSHWRLNQQAGHGQFGGFDALGNRNGWMLEPTIPKIAAAVNAGGPAWLAIARFLVGAAFMGAITDAMLLGHWYLVQPGLARGPLLELVKWCGWLWVPEVVLLLVPPAWCR